MWYGNYPAAQLMQLQQAFDEWNEAVNAAEAYIRLLAEGVNLDPGDLSSMRAYLNRAREALEDAAADASPDELRSYGRVYVGFQPIRGRAPK